ncbi:hypothetical protein SRHO_G00128170 [Serrasalmus rhombeus]
MERSRHTQGTCRSAKLAVYLHLQPSVQATTTQKLSHTDVVSLVRGGWSARHRAGHRQPNGTERRKTPVTGDGAIKYLHILHFFSLRTALRATNVVLPRNALDSSTWPLRGKEIRVVCHLVREPNFSRDTRRRKKRRNRFEKELKVAACLSQPSTLFGPAEAPCSSRLALSGSSLARERRSASLGNRRLDPVPHSGVELREGRRGQRIKGGGGGRINAQCECIQQDRSVRLLKGHSSAFTTPDIIS